MGQPLDVDPNLREADVGVAHDRPGLLVALLEPHAEFVGAARDTRRDLRRVGEITLVGHRRGGCVVTGLAADAKVILVRGARLTGKRQPHARILRVHRVVVSTLRDVLLEILANALRAVGESRVGLRIGRSGHDVPRGIE